MSNLTKKRVHWYEVNEHTGEVIADEAVDVLTSADSVTFDDGDTLQRKYDDGELAKRSEVGNIKGLSTTNKSSLVDAVNEVVTKTTTNAAAIENVLFTSKEYTDTKVANLVGAAPETLDTLEEVAQALEENEDVVTALNGAIGSKASQNDLETLQSNIPNTYMTKENPTGTGSLSLNRKEGTSVATYSSAIGNSTTANGYGSHAQGNSTTASGTYSHAEGGFTKASGTYAHAEGFNAEAKGSYAHAEGQNTLASSKNQHVQGQYNVEDTTDTYAHIVGNGTSASDRSNAHTLDWNGNAWYKGDVTATDSDGNSVSLVSLAGNELTSTLSTGSTSLTFTDSRITANSTLVAVYTSIFGVAVKSAVFANGSLTLTFPAQTENMTVKVVIK